MTTSEIIKRAKKVKHILASTDTETKNKMLLSMASFLLKAKDDILAANRLDIRNAEGKISDVMLDRLSLNEDRIAAMAEGIVSVAGLPDPIGNVLRTVQRPNGLLINRVSVPLGVVAIIYESRPNVTSDAAALALKSGNVCILRGGKEAFNSANAIVDALRKGIEKVGLPSDFVQLVQDISRSSAMELMTAVGDIDLLIPRGGKGLISSVVANAKVPCIETGTGICHIYVDESADFDMALDIIENAKTSRPSVCNAQEVCLVSEEIAYDFLPLLKERLCDLRCSSGKQPVELRLCERSAEIIDGVPAGDNDFDTEYLDYILAVKIVSDVREAIEHISVHSTGHSDGIITGSRENSELFTALVDSAAVYVNASTRFTDGGEFGLGCEMGISTQKLHARGPMGLEELTSYKYIITGNGQIR